MKLLSLQKELLADLMTDASQVCVKEMDGDRWLLIKPNKAHGFVIKAEDLRLHIRGTQVDFTFDWEKYDTYYIGNPSLEIKPTGTYKAYGKGLVQEFTDELGARLIYINTELLKHFEGAQFYTKEGDPVIAVAEKTPGGAQELVGIVLPVNMK